MALRTKSILAMAALATLPLTGARAQEPAVVPAALASVPATHVDHPSLVRLVWQFGVESETFRAVPLFPTLDFLHSRGVHHIVLSPGQTLSADRPDATVRADMPAADLDALLARFKADKLDIASYGVVTFGADEAADRVLFEFGRKLRLKNILATIPADDATIELLDRLANEYRVNVAFVVGASTPASGDNGLVKRVDTRSKRIAFCIDVAELGDNPIARLQKYADRLVEVRLADHDAQGHEVPFGQGKTGFDAILLQLKGQNFKGVCAIHYHGTDSSTVDGAGWAASVNAFSKQVTAIAPPPQPKPAAAANTPAKQP